MHELVIVKNGKVVCDSLMLSEKFGKDHKDVLRTIRNIGCSAEFTERNFALSEFKDGSGRTLPKYEMTRDGFTFVAMGFTGSKAATWKEKYIDAFNKMEALIRERLFINTPVNTTSVPVSLAPIEIEVKSAMGIAKAFGLEGNQAILTANKAVKKLTGVDCLELMDLKALPAPEQQLEYNSTDFGKLYAGGVRANVINCMMELLGVFRSFRDSKNNLKWEITEEGKKYALYKDVEKKTGGVPIKQIFIKDCAKDLISSEILVKAAIRSKEHRIVLSRCKKVEAV